MENFVIESHCHVLRVLKFYKSKELARDKTKDFGTISKIYTYNLICNFDLLLRSDL